MLSTLRGLRKERLVQSCVMNCGMNIIQPNAKNGLKVQKIALKQLEQGAIMQRLDIIIDALERTHKDVFVMKALAAARELKALKPVAMVDHSHPFSDDSVYMIANYKRSFPSGTKLYALDEVMK